MTAVIQEIFLRKGKNEKKLHNTFGDFFQSPRFYIFFESFNLRKGSTTDGKELNNNGNFVKEMADQSAYVGIVASAGQGTEISEDRSTGHVSSGGYCGI